MTLSQLKRQSEQPAAPILRRDLQRLGDLDLATVMVYVTTEGQTESDDLAWVQEVVSTPSECMPQFGRWLHAESSRSRHLELLNDMDVGEPLTLAEAAERGRKMAAEIGDDLVDIDF